MKAENVYVINDNSQLLTKFSQNLEKQRHLY